METTLTSGETSETEARLESSELLTFFFHTSFHIGEMEGIVRTAMSIAMCPGLNTMLLKVLAQVVRALCADVEYMTERSDAHRQTAGLIRQSSSWMSSYGA